MNSQEDNHLFWRDEILQFLYWTRGEGMGERHSASMIARFLSTGEPQVARHLAKMVIDGYLAFTAEQYKLSEFGISEGARRFREEFEPLLSQGHGECNDPGCDCHELGPEYCKNYAPEPR